MDDPELEGFLPLEHVDGIRGSGDDHTLTWTTCWGSLLQIDGFILFQISANSNNLPRDLRYIRSAFG